MNKLLNVKKLFSTKSKNHTNKKSISLTGIKTRLMKRVGHWNYRKITRYFLAFGILITVVTSYFWYSQLYMTPERQFWSAINTSMSTPSVVRTLSQGGSGNQIVQNYRFNFAPQRVIENNVIYTEKNAVTDTKVVTESLVYPSQQFLRYTAFSNSNTESDTNLSIDSVIGKWATQESEDEEESRLNYLSEQVSLVIFGNYGPEIRDELIGEMKKRQVYGTNLSTPLADKIGTEDVSVYTISVSLRDYAELLNRAFVSAGYGEFAPLDPDNYREEDKVNGTVLISKRKNTIVGVSFNGRDERYSNYGVRKNVVKPTAEVTVEQLQAGIKLLFESAL
jgi:hypothetical protein